MFAVKRQLYGGESAPLDQTFLNFAELEMLSNNYGCILALSPRDIGLMTPAKNNITVTS